MGQCNNKRLAILGGSRQGVQGIIDIKQILGCEILVIDRDQNAPGFEHADHKIHASVYHFDDVLPKLLQFHEEKPIDGIMCIACDVPHVVARLAKRLSLPGISIEAADLAVDKLAMKDRLSRDGVMVPDFRAVDGVSLLGGLLKKWGRIVVKPADSRGSKGVTLCSVGSDLAWSYHYALDNSPSNRVIVEQFLQGPQISTESIVIDGHVVTVAFSDRSYEYLDRFSPYIVENGGDMPSSQSLDTLKAVDDIIQQAASSLGIKSGIVKGDIVIHNGVPYVIELAARLSGGYFCTHQIPYSTGVHLPIAAAKAALGETLKPQDYGASLNQHVSTRWLIPESGTIKSFGQHSDVLACNGVLAFDHWCHSGDTIGDAQNAGASVAMVQTTGQSREQSISNAKNALTAFKLVIQK